MDLDEYFMRYAYLTAGRSKDKHTKIGSVIVMGDTLISHGYNGIPRGVLDLDERLERPVKYQYISHSELNAILNCARNGFKTLGAILYTFAPPCIDCTRAIIQAGISKIVLHKQWCELGGWQKWSADEEIRNIMLDESKVSVYSYDKELGIEILRDGKVESV